MGIEVVASTLLISTVIVHFSVCAGWSGGLISRSAVVGKVGGLKWTLWTLILRVRRTQIKCAALVQTENLKSQAAQLSWGRAAPVCYSISHSALILQNVNHPHQNAGSHISTNMTRFLFLVGFFPLARLESQRWWIYYNSLGISFMKLSSWSEIITVIKQLQSKEIGFL